MGVGFFKAEPDGSIHPPYEKMVVSNARFIRGNHDNPNVCRRHTQWIPDGHLEDSMMFIGGGIHKPKLWVFGHWHRSFDKALRSTRFVCLAELCAEAIS